MCHYVMAHVPLTCAHSSHPRIILYTLPVALTAKAMATKLMSFLVFERRLRYSMFV